MEKREETLKTALIQNEEERARWEQFWQENESAIENLNTFIKKIVMDVMVPVGSKALMPGQIHHTNEVFISHFQGMFSKCSAYQAQTICKKRIEMAKERLEQLEKEYDLYQNKMNVPQMGAFPSEGENEIIEEYNEEEEKRWREHHKRRVREHKQKEREKESQDNLKTDNDIMKMLDDLELMEELEEELNHLQIKDDDTLQKLLSGKINVPLEKKRISHSSRSDLITGEVKINVENYQSNDDNSIVNEISTKYKNSTNMRSTDFTNNNSIPNSQDFQNIESDSEDSSDGDIPNEVSQLENETLNCNKTERLKIFKDKLKETEKSLKNLKMQNMDDLHQKAHLLEVREYLIDYVEILTDEIELEEEVKNVDCSPKTHKRKSIRFALEDEIKFIEDNYVEENVIDSEQNANRDIITLNTLIINENFTYNSFVDKKANILEKVEKSHNFTIENQTQQDFNLVDKILNDAENKDSILRITFNHSNQLFEYPGYSQDNFTLESPSEPIIGSPADIYRVFSHLLHDADIERNKITLKPNTQRRNNSNTNGYEDPRTKILQKSDNNGNNKNEISQNKFKSGLEKKKPILKNKEAVKLETHLTESLKPKMVRKKKLPEVDYIGFSSIMGEVIENPTTQPDPLPKEKFVDAHAPKKRISRFKEMRMIPS